MIRPPFLFSLSKIVAAVVATQKRQIVYRGVTDGSGNYTVVYDPVFAPGIVPRVAPDIVPNSDPNKSCRVTASSNAGFTVRAESRSSINVLGVGLALGFGTTALAGQAIEVTVTEP